MKVKPLNPLTINALKMDMINSKQKYYKNGYNEYKEGKLGQNFMKKSQVNSTVARDLRNTKPVFGFKKQSKRYEDNFDNSQYLQGLKNKNGWMEREQESQYRDVASEIDYNDSKSVIRSLKFQKRRNPSQAGSQLTGNNLKRLDQQSHRSYISKGGGGSVYSDARSQFSKYRQRLKELSTRSKSQSINKPKVENEKSQNNIEKETKNNTIEQQDEKEKENQNQNTDENKQDPEEPKQCSN